MFRNAIYLFFVVFIASSCSTTQGIGGGINFFTPEQDLEFGKQVHQEILSKPGEYPILPEKGNEEVYRYIRNMTNKILNTGKVNYKDEFAWEITIIDDGETLNAFATPGGYIYVYTGLIKYLDSENQLAGVIGHEIAHAALRHSTRQMTKIYGFSALASIVTGKSDPSFVQQVVTQLLSLRFSRSHETESDSHSVIYLCGTEYKADGAAGFFRKIENSERPPEFLSTHPNPTNRVANIEGKAVELGCSGSQTNTSQHDRIKALLK